MISVNDLFVEFSAKPLFNGVSFVINDNERVALTGKNGAGKSTLLKIIAGLEHPTTGSISIPSGYTIGYLAQQMDIADETTVIDETRKAFSHLTDLQEELNSIQAEMENRSDFESESYSSLIDRFDYLNHRLVIEGAANMDAEIESTLAGLGFGKNDLNRPTREFSGGWRMRIELAKILLRRPDILLLDEPTNHLDIESIQWLERFLVSKGKAVLLVSHDRAFLDNVTSRTIEISCGKMYDYKVSYTKFVELRRERVEQQMRAYENQQKMIADTRDFIERFRYKATKSVQVQSRIKQLEKIVPIEIDEVDNSRLRLKFPPADRSGDFPLITEGLAKNYGDNNVFHDVEFTIRRGEKVAFVGRNGEGKSTLVKCIMGEIPYTGTLKVGHNVKIGYFAQNQAQLLDPDLTVFETIDNVARGDMRTKVRDILGAFMFGGEAADKPVRVLSGGEKTRLAMIRLLLEPVNFLILDEPTNHLDMASKDVLKEAIADFNGTVILISHDRYFLDGLVEKVYEFGDGRVKEHLGGIYDFLRRKDFENLKEIEATSLNNASKSDTMPSTPQKAEHSKKYSRNAGLSYFEQKELAKIKSRAEKRVKEAELSVEKLEQELKEIENSISKGDASPEILEKYNTVNKNMENAISVWELAQTELDNLMKTDRP